MNSEAAMKFFRPPEQDMKTGEALPACNGSLPYFEDYGEERVHTIGPRMISEEEILEYGRKFDRQFIHTDPERALAGTFGTLVASGWHIMSIMMQMLVGTVIHEQTAIAGKGVDSIKWKRPVAPGDVLRLVVRPEQVRPPRPGLKGGLVRFDLQMMNQNDVVVMTAGLLGYIRQRGETEQGNTAKWEETGC